jgi:CopG family nickel-responsive transcriptional regulator
MAMDDDLSRIGISLPKNLLDRFDEILNYRGYSSRSEGIRDAIRTYITYFKWMSDV